MTGKSIIVQNPARKLALLLQTRVTLEAAKAECSMRIGGKNIRQFKIVSNAEGFFLANEGPGIEDDAAFTLTEDHAFAALADAVQGMTRVCFHLPFLPTSKGVENVSVDLHANVIVRTIEFYEIRRDEVMARYDVVVEAIHKD